MPKYNVILTLDASMTVEVVAENEEEAMEIAMESAETPTLCCQCAQEVDLNDIIDAIEAVEI